jgi:hypothetical protein
LRVGFEPWSDSVSIGRHARRLKWLPAIGPALPWAPRWALPTQHSGFAAVPDQADPQSLRARGEEALGELAQALVDNPVFSGALARALGAGERAASAQRQAIGALNLAAGADVERLEQRLRSFSARLEAIEDQLDDLARDFAALRRDAEPQDGAGDAA